MKTHLRTVLAAFAVLGLALVGCEVDNDGVNDTPPADDTNGFDDDGFDDDGLDDDGLDDDV